MYEVGRPPDEPATDLLRRGYRYAHSLTHDPEKARDLIQDACLAVVRAGGSWTRGYLFAAVRSRYINSIRRLDLVVIDPVEDIEGEVAPEGEDLLGVEMRLIRREEIAEALGLLSPGEREALYLAAVEGYTAREIGELTDRPRGTVLSLLHRARKKIRKHTEQGGEARA